MPRNILHTPPSDIELAYHEAGHVVTAYLLGRGSTVRRGVTIDREIATCWSANRWPHILSAPCWKRNCSSADDPGCDARGALSIRTFGLADMALPNPSPEGKLVIPGGAWSNMQHVVDDSDREARACIQITLGGPAAAKIFTGVYRRQPQGDHAVACQYRLVIQETPSFGWWRRAVGEATGRLREPGHWDLVEELAQALLAERTLWRGRVAEVVEGPASRHGIVLPGAPT